MRREKNLKYNLEYIKMDWHKNISLYVFAVLLVLLGLSLSAASTEFGIGAIALALILLVYNIWEEGLQDCKLIKYIGLPFTVFGFLVLLIGLVIQVSNYQLQKIAGYLLSGGFYIELVGIILFAIGYFVAYYIILASKK